MTDSPIIRQSNFYPMAHVTDNMEFCPRCGRYLKDDEYQCPECGNVVRQMPRNETIPPEFSDYYNNKGEPISLKKLIFEKWFFVALAIAFAISFAITFYWRFTILLFCLPLFVPWRRLSIAAGLLVGLTGGTATALLINTFVLNATL